MGNGLIRGQATSTEIDTEEDVTTTVGASSGLANQIYIYRPEHNFFTKNLIHQIAIKQAVFDAITA